ncbi:hypothetical protein PROFUN_09619 [Planoprotostelium fungivorum]|uniref:R3H domain-containing protein n=1 Tax=Planoprotostelium fungivorum TaxID=1890364 RepID=A0A2P6MNU0_9EUKA|nr:hypothetical protein PROFUN_09619 [Planoprotostelium fungivorum]
MEFGDLLQSLSFTRKRVFLLQLEKEFDDLIERQRTQSNGLRLSKRFISMTSGNRWLIHQTANRFKLHSSSVGWGKDKRTRITADANSISPSIRYSDFIPSAVVEELQWITISNQEEKTLDVAKTTTDVAQTMDVAEDHPVIHDTSSSLESKKRMRADAPIYVPSSSFNPISQTEHVPPQEKTKKMRGRGASTFGKTEAEMDQMREAEDVPSTLNDTEPLPEDEIAEDLPSDITTIDVIYDWSSYDARVQREEEAKNKTYYKTNADLNRGRTSWSDAWKLKQSGEGFVQFEMSSIKWFRIDIRPSSASRHTFSLHFDSTRSHPFPLFTSNNQVRVLIKDERDRDIAGEDDTFSFGATQYPDHPLIRFTSPEIVKIDRFGFRGETKSHIREIYIRGKISAVPATRDHIYQITTNDDSNLSFSNLIRKQIQLDDGRCIIIFNSIQDATETFTRWKEGDYKEIEDMTREYDDGVRAELEHPVQQRPSADARAASRFILNAVKNSQETQ